MQKVKTEPSLLFLSPWPVDQTFFWEEISQELHSICMGFWKDNISGLPFLLSIALDLITFKHLLSLKGKVLCLIGQVLLLIISVHVLPKNFKNLGMTSYFFGVDI